MTEQERILLEFELRSIGFQIETLEARKLAIEAELKCEDTE